MTYRVPSYPSAALENAVTRTTTRPRKREPRPKTRPSGLVLPCGTELKRYDLVRLGNSPILYMVITASDGTSGPRVRICDKFGKKIRVVRGRKIIDQMQPVQEAESGFQPGRRTVRAAILAAMLENSTTRKLLKQSLRKNFLGWIEKEVNKKFGNQKLDGTMRKRNVHQFTGTVKNIIDTAQRTNGGPVTIDCTAVRENLPALIGEYETRHRKKAS